MFENAEKMLSNKISALKLNPAFKRANTSTDVKDMSAALKEGWLTKQKHHQGSVLGKSRKRWFSITDDGDGFGPRMYYFKSPAQREANPPLGIIDLTDYDSIVTDPKKKSGFIMQNTQDPNVRVFQLVTESEKEQEQWVAILQMLATRTVKKKRADAALQEVKLKELKDRTSSMLYNLYVKVCDAKDLVKKDSTLDPYCVVKIEKAHLRTRTVWNNRSPIWNEDFNLILDSPENSVLTVSVWDNKPGWQDQIIGKLELPHHTLKNLSQPEQWFTLLSCDAKGYISGDVHLKFKYNPPTENLNGTLFVKIIAARNLASKDSNGLSDPYIKLKFGNEKLRTKIKKKTLNPFYNEVFEFTVTRGSTDTELILTVWDWDFTGTNDFMGYFSINLAQYNLDEVVEGWFTLQENEKFSNKKKDKKKEKKEKEVEVVVPKPVGQIRLCLKYIEELILPGADYNDLLVLLLGDRRLITVFGKIVAHEDLDALAKSLCHIFEYKGGARILINHAVAAEIEKTQQPEVIFRGNTLATKLVDSYMKMKGSAYLREVLNPILTSIYESKASFEVDPSKAEKGQDIKKNLALLELKASELLEAILNSVSIIPAEMKEVFANMQKLVLEKWPNELNVRYSVIAGFFFLRFINPSLTSPKRMGVMDDHPDMKTARALTLMAKIVQNLSNLVQFKAKEAYMQDLNYLIVSNIDTMKKFLNSIATVPDDTSLHKVPNINFEKELSYIHNYLSRNKIKVMDEIREDPAFTEKVEKVLIALSDSKTRNLSSSGKIVFASPMSI